MHGAAGSGGVAVLQIAELMKCFANHMVHHVFGEGIVDESWGGDIGGNLTAEVHHSDC